MNMKCTEGKVSLYIVPTRGTQRKSILVCIIFVQMSTHCSTCNTYSLAACCTYYLAAVFFDPQVSIFWSAERLNYSSVVGRLSRATVRRHSTPRRALIDGHVLTLLGICCCVARIWSGRGGAVVDVLWWSLAEEELLSCKYNIEWLGRLTDDEDWPILLGTVRFCPIRLFSVTAVERPTQNECKWMGCYWIPSGLPTNL